MDHGVLGRQTHAHRMHLWSSAFLPESADWATAVVDERAWKRLVDLYEDAPRMFLRISAAAGEWYAALGTPVRFGEELGPEPRAFLPHWMLARAGCEGVGEAVETEWLPAEAFPEATRIVLQPHDSAFYHADAKEELEAALTRLGVLQAGTSIVVPLAALGGYEITFEVVRTEPANVVLMQGDEVALEFEAALDGAAEAQAAEPRPATPDDFGPMVPVAAPVAAPTGNIIGGTNRRMSDGRPWNPWREDRSANGRAGPKVSPV